MEAFAIVFVLVLAGFVAGVAVGKKYAEIDTFKMVKEYQDYAINGETLEDMYDKEVKIYE